ncbi:ribosome-inactivating family protein [Streptomyces sp. T028]|uniref:ribosome-inactivating family protein n=1 Tax=Streptomyces sp. T028 TaxID=3394379 RepID=UPI003A8BFC8A
MSRKFLALFLGIATVLGGAALVVPQFQRQAEAVDEVTDVRWDLADGVAGYNNMINAVRQRATGGQVLREGVLEVDPNSSDTFTVNIRDSRAAGPSTGGDSLVRLIVRARDLFVVGWLSGTDPKLPVFYFKGDDVGYRGPGDNQPVTNLSYNGSYTDLEREAGRARDGITLNSAAWANAWTTLRDAATTSQRDQARSMMLFIMAVAEGARFDPVQTAFAQSFGDAGSHTVTPAEASLMLNWGKASQQLVDSLNNATPINFTIDDPATPEVDFEATTISTMAAILAIALLQNSQ